MNAKCKITINEGHTGQIEWSQNPGSDEFEAMAADAENYILGPTMNRYIGPWPLIVDIDEEDEGKLSIDGNGTLYWD